MLLQPRTLCNRCFMLLHLLCMLQLTVPLLHLRIVVHLLIRKAIPALRSLSIICRLHVVLLHVRYEPFSQALQAF